MTEAEKKSVWRWVKTNVKRIAHTLPAITSIMFIFGAGWATCSFVHYQDFKDAVAQNREDYDHALDLLSRDYRDSLEALVPKIESAANTAEEAAATADKAATKADKAATKAGTPVKVAAPTVIVRTQPATAPNADQINRSVERANRSLGGK